MTIEGVYSMSMENLRNFNEMQRNMSESLQIVMKHSKNPLVRQQASSLLDKVQRNIIAVDEWMASNGKR